MMNERTATRVSGESFRNRVLQGRYRLSGRLAGSAVSELWRAQDETTGKRVTVVMFVSLQADLRDRFVRDAEKLERFDLQAIAPIRFVGEVDGIPFAVIEPVEGMDLAGYAARLWEGVTGERWIRNVVRLFLGLVRGVEALHAAGVVHRGLEASDIVVTPKHIPVVAQLGLERDAEPWRRETVAVSEQENIRQLGTILKQVLLAGVERGRCRGPRYSTEIDPWLDGILNGMLSADPRAQFKSGQVSRRLELWLGADPETAEVEVPTPMPRPEAGVLA